MKAITFFLLTMFAMAGLADTIITDSGDYVDAPAGHVAVFVPTGTNEVLIAIEAVKVITPKPVVTTDPGCTPPGELSFGGEPCPE